MKIQKHQIYAFVELARCILVFVLAEVSPWVLEHHQDQEGQTLTLQKAGKKILPSLSSVSSPRRSRQDPEPESEEKWRVPS